MRICVVGAGLAGALLAWRLASVPGVEVVLIAPQLLDGTASDATSASGGGVRAYEPNPANRELATESLAELLDSVVLRNWARYVPTGAVYVRDSAAHLGGLPVSAIVLDAAELASRGWAVPPGAAAVYEPEAGYVDPHALRRQVLHDIAGRVTVLDEPVRRVEPDDYDTVVVAAGAWTGDLLRRSGLPATGYRTKSIQYSIYSADGWRPPVFVDETSGLFGRPTADGGLLLGVPSTRWDVPAGSNPTTPTRHAEAVLLAGIRFPRLRLGAAISTSTAADCYTDPPILSLRPVIDGVFTFTGGSGGSVKTALAASRRAANQLTP